MQNSKLDLSWANLSAKDLQEIVGKIKLKLKEFKEEIVKIPKENLSFENLIHREEVLNAEAGRLDGCLFGYVNLHTDEKIQSVARKVELEISKFLGEFIYDEEIYKQFINYYSGNYKKEKKNLTGEQIKIVEDSNKGYKKIGMHLDKKTKKLLLDKKNKINKLAQEFDVLLVENYKKGLWFKKEELKGVPEENFKNFKFDEKKNKYFVNCSGRDDLGTDYPIIKKYCEVTETRKKVTEFNEQGVGEKNNKKLAEILNLRSEIVKILGFKTWADYAMEEEMMNKPTEAKTFLEDLIKKLTPDYQKENHKIEAILKKEKIKLDTSSWAYGEKLSKNNTLSVKEEDYKPYFELEKVLQTLFKAWENYFDIKTEPMTDLKIFHNDTKVLKFTNKKTGELFGYGCMDLHPRDGKYGHACVADIFKKYVDMNGNKQEGFTFLICNFKRANEGKTFISLSDMTTLFHEAGHMLHMILMKNNYTSTGSTSRDFVEIPSQFHENFLLNKEFIKNNFKHFETNESMNEEMLKNISNFMKKGEVRTWIRVSMSSVYDQEVHSKNILKYANNPKLIDNKFEELWKKYAKIPATKTRHWPSQWGHIVGGYDARYYSYVISKVYAQDIWHEFAKNGIKKGEISEKYKKMLEAGGSKDEKELVKEFLERKVSLKPFLEILKD